MPPFSLTVSILSLLSVLGWAAAPMGLSVFTSLDLLDLSLELLQLLWKLVEQTLLCLFPSTLAVSSCQVSLSWCHSLLVILLFHHRLNTCPSSCMSCTLYDLYFSWMLHYCKCFLSCATIVALNQVWKCLNDIWLCNNSDTLSPLLKRMHLKLHSEDGKQYQS